MDDTEVEYAVRWPDGAIEECRDLTRAVEVADLYKHRGVVLVQCTITRSDWTEAEL